ncbi:hypothetical protein [Mesorhizobium sp. 1B3]|uniref:hypothetical protein n=1 Tax=Mesorhizobium sp. 1B3 TaxID=3243599 RepID=UPI003D9567A7
MALNATWDFARVKGDSGTIRAVEWTITWTDPDFPGTQIISSGITIQGVEIPAATATKAQVEAAVTAVLGNQLDAIRAHVAETMPAQHRWESLQVIEVPGIVPTAA